MRFSHGRRIEGKIGLWYRTKGKRGDLKAWPLAGLTPSPRGGLTQCRVTLPDGTEIVGTAECSDRDNFSKKIGRDIALGRALKVLATK